MIIFGVGFAALNTGNNLLYLVLSLLLSFLVLSGVLSESALRGIRIRRRIPRELYARGENSIKLEITNDQRRIAAFAIVVEDRLRSAPDGRPQVERDDDGTRRRNRRRRKHEQSEIAGRCFALRIAAGATETRRYAFAPSQRGALAFSSFRVSTRFPFGLFLKSRDVEAADEVLVYPEIGAAGHSSLAPRTSRSGNVSIAERGSGGVVASVREYQEGDSPRHVHWRSALRRRALLVCETEEDCEAEIEVRLEAARAHRDDGATVRFEQGVSRAASLVVHHLHEGHSVSLRTETTFLAADAGTRQKARLLSFLALVELDGRVATPTQIAGAP